MKDFKNIKLPFTYEKINDNILLIDNKLKIHFTNICDYNNFMYHTVRQYELGILPNKETIVLPTEKYSIFDSVFNLKGDFKQFREFNRQLDYLISKSEKAFWGLDQEYNEALVNVGKKDPVMMDYVLEKSDEFCKKLMIQPDDKAYNESFFVYTDSEHTPNKSIEVFYTFIKYPNEDMLSFRKMYSNDWIY